MSKQHNPGADRAPMMESLESRQLLSHTISATRLTFTTTATSGTESNPISQSVSAKLTSNGLPLRTATVYIVVDGKYAIGQGQTGRSGYVSLKVPNVLAGTHTLAAYFLGATRYASSQSKATSLAITAPRYTTTASGLKYATITPGTGATTVTGNTVDVTWAGYLSTGYSFGTSLTGGVDALLSVILGNSAADDLPQGLDEGLTGMKVGETRVLVVPPSLGYGAQGNSNNNIPANATLIYFVTMQGISG